MGLGDIFGNQKTPPQKKAPEVTAIAGPALAVPEALAGAARAASDAYDRKASLAAAYKSAHTKAMAKVDAELSDLKGKLDAATRDAALAGSSLEEAMLDAGVTKVPMLDRKPIEIKVSKGQKKNITKTWLTETLGEKTAQDIWSRVPTKPDKRTLVVPPPYDDQPDD